MKTVNNFFLMKTVNKFEFEIRGWNPTQHQNCKINDVISIKSVAAFPT